MFGSQAAAYADEPWETVNYAACHDQEVLFDQVPACLSLGSKQRPKPRTFGPTLHKGLHCSLPPSSLMCHHVEAKAAICLTRPGCTCR